MPPDPYRTLGLSRGASLEEVKRAYRRLAKANHPDRAGEGSLARFLEIQAAYDGIAGGDVGAGGQGAASGSTPGTRRAWDADPDRADATRRAYGSRTRRPPRDTTGPGRAGAGRAYGRSADGPRPEGDPASRGGGGGGAAPAGGDPRAGADPPGSMNDRGSSGDRPPRGTRQRNKATMGSTSYDGAEDQPFEPDWGGASWYGTTSGTYWTLNPREYADPRKHGPEYQARARRAAAGRQTLEEALDGTAAAAGGAVEADRDDPLAAGIATGADDGSSEPAAGGAAAAGPRPSHTTTSWWDATSADGAPTPASPASARAGAAQHASSADAGRKRHANPAPAGPPRATASTASDDAGPLLPGFDAARWLETGRGGVPIRAARAVLGWAPIALGIGWVAGEITGCGRYSAACDAAAAPVAWFVQVAILALLLLVPRLAVATTVATVTVLAVAIPGATVLSATGTDARDTLAPTALGGLLVVAWVVGLGGGLWREIRAIRGPAVGGASSDAPGGPVS